MIPLNKTKIVATLGPASDSAEVIEQMILTGVDVFRVNFSHVDYDRVRKTIETIQATNTKLNTHVAILADLQGPKLRIGEVENGLVELVPGSEVIFTTDKCIGTAERLFITYPQFPKDVKVGEKILVEDGKFQLEVIATNLLNEVRAKVLYGGKLASKKGVNLPNTKISMPCLTEKDLFDLEFALSCNVNWIGLSFVRNAADIIELRHIITNHGRRTRIIAKIEKPEAIADIDNIIAETDAIMVARGDLGVEIPFEQVPLIQKEIVRKCLDASKPVIIATQMMESMITNIQPTRAEVSDVANGVIDGADAVMLSGETSVGAHPVKVIEAMQKIIAEVEAGGYSYNRKRPAIEKSDERFITESICYSAAQLTEATGTKAIVTMTQSGFTAFKLSGYRPNAIIYMFTSNHAILDMMNLVWGVRGFYYDKSISTDHTIADIKHILKSEGWLTEGEYIINIASIPLSEKGKTNMLKISTI
jgi:pyruvate kinase